MRWIHAFQYGLQGGATQFKAMPSAKHAFDYDLENWGGLDRASFNAQVSERDRKRKATATQASWHPALTCVSFVCRQRLSITFPRGELRCRAGARAR